MLLYRWDSMAYIVSMSYINSVVTNRTKGCMWKKRKNNSMSHAGFESGTSENKD